jgi:hypothetical protein
MQETLHGRAEHQCKQLFFTADSVESYVIS